jgi:hypothetical protein
MSIASAALNCNVQSASSGCLFKEVQKAMCGNARQRSAAHGAMHGVMFWRQKFLPASDANGVW